MGCILLINQIFEFFAEEPTLPSRQPRLTQVSLKDYNVNVAPVDVLKMDKNVETERPWIIPQPGVCKNKLDVP